MKIQSFPALLEEANFGALVTSDNHKTNSVPGALGPVLTSSARTISLNFYD